MPLVKRKNADELAGTLYIHNCNQSLFRVVHLFMRLSFRPVFYLTLHVELDVRFYLHSILAVLRGIQQF